MKSLGLFGIVLAMVLLASADCRTEDVFQDMDQAHEARVKAMEQQWEDQLRQMEEDWITTREETEAYVRDEVLPAVQPDAESFAGRDGVQRRKYRVSIDLVPENIRIRAERYLPVVEEKARRFKLKPQLVMAVIQTESSFNPKAVSHCNAVGIMQIIPRHAGGRPINIFTAGTRRFQGNTCLIRSTISSWAAPICRC